MPSIPSDNLFAGIQNLSPEFQKAFQVSVTAERKPIEQIEKRKANLEEKVSLLDDVLGKVDAAKKCVPELGTPFAIKDLAFNSDDPKAISGSADKREAETGKHSLEVKQLAGSTSALTNGFEDKEETRFGTGYITFETYDGDTKEIFIDNDNATLDGIAKVINQSHMGVRANVINDVTDPDAPYKLMISADGIGATENVVFPEFYLAGGEDDLFMDQQREATNAVIKYKGFEIQSPTNQIKDLIQGVTLDLKGLTDPGKPTTVTIEQDLPKTTAKVKDLVEKMNSVFSFIQQQNKLDEKTQTQKTLGGDYGIFLSEQRLRSALSETYLDSETRNVRSAGDLGIQFNKNGTLQFDEKKFELAVQNNFDDVVTFLTGDGETGGVMNKIGSALSTISGPASGVLSNQKKNYTEQIMKLNKEIEVKEKQVEQKAERLKGQLAKAQSSLEALQGQSGFIQSNNSPIPGM